MADQTQTSGLNQLLKSSAAANEYFLSLPAYVREKLRDCRKQIESEQAFYNLAESFCKEEN